MVCLPMLRGMHGLAMYFAAADSFMMDGFLDYFIWLWVWWYNSRDDYLILWGLGISEAYIGGMVDFFDVIRYRCEITNFIKIGCYDNIINR